MTTREKKLKLPLTDCESCPLYREASYHPHNYRGNLENPDVVFIGEGPGRAEEETGLVFMGRAGKLLERLCKRFEINNYALFNIVQCHPKIMDQRGKSKDRKPTSTEIRLCRENLEAFLEQVKPRFICTLGAPATNWMKITGGIGRNRGVLVETSYGKVFPTYHPAYILRSPGFIKDLEEDLQTLKSLIDGTFKEEEMKPRGQYAVVKTLEGVLKVEQMMSNAKHIAFDIETDGLTFHRHDIMGIGFCRREGYAYYIPILTAVDKESFWGENQQEVLKSISRVLTSDNKKIAQNGKFDIKFIYHYWGIKVKNFWLDTMLMHYLIDENRRHGLKEVGGSHFPEMKDYNRKLRECLTEKKEEEQDFGKVPTQILGEYCGMDCETTFRLAKLLLPRLSTKQKKLLFDLYMPLSEIYTDAELVGIKIDKEYVENLMCKYEGIAGNCLEDVYEHAGEEFNINSYPQLGQILYKKLKFPVIKKTNSGKPATDKATLKELPRNHKHSGIIEGILKYRSTLKMISTYFRSMLEKVDINDRIHPNFKLTGTVTGRLSSSSPSVQNIPRGPEMRGMFIPEEGYELVSVDYSQIELRVMAFYSKDKEMTRGYMEGEDIHLATACVLFDLPPEKITKTQRKYAKLWNFGAMYGGAPRTIMNAVNEKLGPEDRKITLKEAERFRAIFFKKYGGIERHIREVHRLITKKKYIENIFGRRRRLPEIDSPEQEVQAEALRQGLNAEIQGTASDLTQISVTKLPPILKNRKTRFLFTVHDDILFESPKNELNVILNIKTMMEDVPEGFNFPVEADIERYPKRWGNDPIKYEDGKWKKGEEF